MKEFPIVVFSRDGVIHTPQINITYENKVEENGDPWLLETTESTKDEIQAFVEKQYHLLYAQDLFNDYRYLSADDPYTSQKDIDKMYQFFNRQLGSKKEFNSGEILGVHPTTHVLLYSSHITSPAWQGRKTEDPNVKINEFMQGLLHAIEGWKAPIQLPYFTQTVNRYGGDVVFMERHLSSFLWWADKVINISTKHYRSV